MKLVLSTFILIFSSYASAQIADGSFFPSVRSLNPGVAHLRKQAMASLSVSQKEVEKVHEVTTGGIEGGIRTDVELQKNTFFTAGKFGPLAVEILADKEFGEKIERINSTTYGARNVKNESESMYAGATVGIKWLGLSYETANYTTDYRFRVGEPPDVSAKDIDTEIDYTLLKAGTAFNLGGFTFGAFFMKKDSDESYAYTYYDPTSGAKGTTEVWPATSSAQGYGAGIGYTSKKFRFEGSFEQMDKPEVKFKDNPQDVIKEPPPSSRISGVVELRWGKISLGARVRQIVGNFTDLEDLISSNLLYSEAGEDDTRLETSFNFGFGSDKGWSFSAFYTQSETKTDEESTIFDNDVKYPAKTTATSMGGTVSYYF